jgi:hypothetical protein
MVSFSGDHFLSLFNLQYLFKNIKIKKNLHSVLASHQRIRLGRISQLRFTVRATSSHRNAGSGLDALPNRKRSSHGFRTDPAHRTGNKPCFAHVILLLLEI